MPAFGGEADSSDWVFSLLTQSGHWSGQNPPPQHLLPYRCVLSSVEAMKRREFITLLGGGHAKKEQSE
jgi:hypothetical protein